MLRLSPSIIDAYRYFRDPDCAWMTFENLAKQWMRIEAANVNMSRGTALHKILETRKDTPKHATEMADGRMFTFTGLEKAWAVVPRLGTPEQKIEIIVRGHQVAMVIDHIIGLIGTEYKTVETCSDKKMQEKVERYANSFQWRVYTYAFGLEQMNYNIFACKPLAKAKEADYYQFEVVDVIPFSVKPYPGLAEEVEATIEEVAQFAYMHDMAQYLQPKPMEVCP